jgi:methionyl-tRNA synthetase
VSKYYLTTAIPYPSGEPHVGHSFEMIAADAIVRFKRLRGIDTYFLGGLDENSQRVSRQAEVEGMDPMTYVDEAAERYQAVWRSLDVGFDDFVRTTEPRHHKAVNEFFARVFANDDIYEGEYEGWYCVQCEAFYTDDELAEQMCPVHASKPEWVAERNYFFRLSKYQKPIVDLYESQPDFVLPEARRNEMLGIIRDGLRDFSISRASVSWGIPLPNDPNQRIYVWFDALINYITGVGFGQSDRTSDFDCWWPADAHVIGKDIVRFHALYWPAMLMSAGLPLPRHVVVHGWVGFEGAAMSQSAGHLVKPAEVISQHGSDALRYFLLREVPFDRDGDFKWDNMRRRYQDDLGNDLGNLVLRTTSMLGRYFEGLVPERGDLTEIESQLRAAADTSWTLAEGHYEGWRLHLALVASFDFVAAVNRYIDRTEPWRLAKDDGQRERLGTVLNTVLEALRHIAIQIHPAMPRTSTAILAQLGLPPAGSGEWGGCGWTGLPVGHHVPGGKALFPRLDST